MTEPRDGRRPFKFIMWVLFSLVASTTVATAGFELMEKDWSNAIIDGTQIYVHYWLTRLATADE